MRSKEQKMLFLLIEGIKKKISEKEEEYIVEVFKKPYFILTNEILEILCIKFNELKDFTCITYCKDKKAYCKFYWKYK